MANIQIKQEINDNLNLQCRTCLSMGRKMVSVGEFANIYRNLTLGFEFIAPKVSEQLVVCWECHALLYNIKKFQYKVQRANEMLRLKQNQLCSLSNLTTVILNHHQPNEIYTFDQCVTVKPENCFKTELYTDLVKPGEKSGFDSEDNNISPQSGKETIRNSKTYNAKPEIKESKKVVNKWAKERAMLNKKPKYKVFKEKKRNLNVFFSKIRLTEDELQNYIKCQRGTLFKCAKCSIQLHERKLFISHILRCYDEQEQQRFVCEICCKSLSHKRTLTTHIEDHYYVFKCKLCNHICYDRNQRWRHMVTHKIVLQCLKCTLLFGSRQEFFKHFKEWHEKFICDQCGISFKMRYCIEDHIRKQHSVFECKPCGKRFKRYNGLWLHNKIQHCASTSSAYCVECDKRYPDYYRYRWHLTNSARHRPREKLRIPCPDCDKVFSKNIYMKDHYNLVHLKNYKYRCDECNKNFTRNADLTKHNRRVHEGIMPPRNKICNTCGRGFTTNKILANHVRTHTGERPYPCTQCAARFAQSAALASHVRVLHSR